MTKYVKMLDTKHKKAFDKIKSANNILLVTHYRPDGDALASICAMGNVLDGMDKKYTPFCKDQPPAPYSFLPGIEKITNDRNKLNFPSFKIRMLIPQCGKK